MKYQLNQLNQLNQLTGQPYQQPNTYSQPLSSLSANLPEYQPPYTAQSSTYTKSMTEQYVNSTPTGTHTFTRHQSEQYSSSNPAINKPDNTPTTKLNSAKSYQQYKHSSPPSRKLKAVKQPRKPFKINETELARSVLYLFNTLASILQTALQIYLNILSSLPRRNLYTLQPAYYAPSPIASNWLGGSRCSNNVTINNYGGSVYNANVNGLCR